MMTIAEYGMLWGLAGFCVGALTASAVGVWWAWRAMAPHELRPTARRWGR